MRRAAAGFTLIEMMVTVAIVAILAGMAAYSMRGAIESANAVSGSERIYTMVSQARALAITKQSQVVLLVDMDDSVGASGHGGVWEILDPDREFSPSKMSGWSVSYSAGSGNSPITANSGIWSNTPSRAEVYNQVRFTDPGLEGHVQAPTAADLTAFDAVATTTLAASPWPLPATTSIADTYSGYGCSFCQKTSPTGVGYILVRSDGTMALSDPDDLTKLQVDGNKGYLLLSNKVSKHIDRALYVATPTGLVHAQGAK